MANNTVDVICYGKRETWRTREEAQKFYMEAMMMCEGSEQARYSQIYSELTAGLTVCTDGEKEFRKPDTKIRTYA
jgi:hypothetical protein